MRYRNPWAFALVIIFAVVSLSGCDFNLSGVKSWPGSADGEGGTLGALGCSMTRDLFDPGLSKNTPLAGWLKRTPAGVHVLQKYSGGTVGRWAEGNNIKWAAFAAGDAAWVDTYAIFWQICIKASEVVSDPLQYVDELRYIANRIQTESPGVPIYVFGMPTYTEGHVCPIAGPDGVEFSYTLARLAADSTVAEYAEGLELGPLSPAQVKPAPDLCHVNAAGAAFEGQQLENWLYTL